MWKIIFKGNYEMKAMKILSVVMLLTAKESYGADIIDHIEQGLDTIEGLAQTNPEDAKIKLKDFQRNYGNTPEFEIFMDRYDLLKSSLYSNNNSWKHTGEIQNVVTNFPSQQEVSKQEVVMDMPSLANILPDIKPGTLVLLDIDDTLMARSFQTGKHVLLEENFPEMLEGMRARGAKVIAFTHRSMDSDAQQRLQGLGVHLEHNSISELRNDYISNNPGYLNGILYAATRPKGDVLPLIIAKYTEAYGRPSQILFADDTEDNVRGICDAAKGLNLNSKCFHYSGGNQFNRQQHAFMGNREFSIAPTRAEENEMNRYGINSVEELRSRKREAGQLGISLGEYLQML